MKNFNNTPIAELAAIVADHLQAHGIEVVLVGGLAVEIYTENLYLTKDIDMVNTNHQPSKRLNVAMAELGFQKRGRVYINATTDVSVEFPSAPLSVGDELIKTTTHQQVANRSIPILKVEDVVKDRLAAYIHWRDRQSLIQAVAILLKHELHVDSFEQFCLREGTRQIFQLLVKLHNLAAGRQLESMAELENLLAEFLIRRL